LERRKAEHEFAIAANVILTWCGSHRDSSQRRNMTEIAELKSFSLSYDSETADASD